MEEKNSRPLNTIWVVVICTGVALLIIGLVLTIWFGYRYFNSKITIMENSATTSKQTITPSTATQTQIISTESPAQAAENFIKSIFSTFPGSSVNLAKAKKYLSTTLRSKVNDTKESYWDLHGYIHSGPCSVSTAEISKTDTSAVVEITTEWGETCIGLAEPYFRYKMSLANGQWVIDEIEQLKSSEEQEQVPRDF